MKSKLFNIKKSKKAVVAGQIFIYILAAVIVALILVYGYGAIKEFGKRGKELEFLTLKTEMENTFKKIITDYGSVERPDIRIPGKYTHLCFVDKDYSTQVPQLQLDETNYPNIFKFCDNEPVACAGWEEGRNNLFLIPDGSEAFDVGKIEIGNVQNVNPADPTKDSYGESPYFLCFKNFNGKIHLNLESKGNRVIVSEYLMKTY